jgi:hypothetical protein
MQDAVKILAIGAITLGQDRKADTPQGLDVDPTAVMVGIAATVLVLAATPLEQDEVEATLVPETVCTDRNEHAEAVDNPHKQAKNEPHEGEDDHGRIDHCDHEIVEIDHDPLQVGITVSFACGPKKSIMVRTHF